jgi:hypothetical protein
VRRLLRGLFLDFLGKQVGNPANLGFLLSLFLPLQSPEIQKRLQIGKVIAEILKTKVIPTLHPLKQLLKASLRSPFLFLLPPPEFVVTHAP